MSDFILCGVLKVNESFSDIVCDPSTGDLIFCDDILGNCVLSNMSITDPMLMQHDNLVSIALKSGTDGVIMSDTYLIELNNYKADYKSYASGMKITHTVSYDLDTEYEGVVEY